MSDRFTSEQRAALEAQGRVIVSASAGSGKTTVMIEKIIRLIKSGVGVDEILAVTFTKKAAAQMKEKLCKALIEAINAEGITAEKRDVLKKQLSEVPNSDISTIHSLCSKLIRTHFYAAGVENTFRVIGGDDADGTALKNAALDELLEEGYEGQNGEKDEAFAHLLQVYWRKKSDNALRGIFLKTYDNLRDRADYKEFLAASTGYDEGTFREVCADLYRLFREKCKYYRAFVEEELYYFSDDGKSAQLSLASELLDWIDELLLAPDYFAFKAVEKPKFTANRKGKDADAERLAHIAKLSFLKERVVDAYESETAKLLSYEEELARFVRSGETAAALAVYLLKFDEKYARLKMERGVLDYNDLEHKALALLGDAEIAAEIKGKYRYVFVDEYQDVNPVQEEIVSRLSGENLFLVGDVKQSIYGFRGSKSRFFVEKQKQFEGGDGISLFMTRNFRSSDKVLDAVNRQFSLAMTTDVCSVDYAHGSFMERGGRYALNSGKVAVHYLGEPEKTETVPRGVYSVRAKTEKRTAAMSAAAKLIRHIIEQERRSKYYDPDSGEWKQVQYSDIAILSRKMKGQITETVAALSAEGVPVTAAASVNVCEYSEVKTLIDILSLIDNAEQDIPLCSALLSAMGDLTADELTEIRLAYTDERFFRNACKKYAAEKSDKLAYKLRNFYAYFEKIRSLSRVLGAGELLARILAETHMESRLLSRENGGACMRRIQRFIEETGADGPLCVHAFLERLRDLDYDIEYSENGGEDSVKVLTMHSSKGLEYPIVILDNLSGAFRGADHDEVLIEEKYGLAPRAFDAKKMTKQSTLLRRLNELKETESARADELNLYYVALTRAKYGLHMIFDKRTVTPDVKYARSFAEFTDFSVWEEYETKDEIFDVPKQERQALAFNPDETLVRRIMQAFIWSYPMSGYENLPVKSSATQLIAGAPQEGSLAADGVADVGFGREELPDEIDFEAAENLKTGSGEYVSAKESGVAYHAFLERFDFSLLFDSEGVPVAKSELENIISAALERLAAGGEVDCGLLSKTQLLRILSNPVFYELRDMRLYKERQFLASLPVKDTYGRKPGADEGLATREDGEEMIFQGAIDLLAVGEDEVRIIDYKYSAKDGEYLREHYAPQLALYRLATAKILRVPIEKIRCSIVNIRRGFQIDL